MNDAYIREVSERIDRDRIRRAKEQRPEDKFYIGPELFDLACEFSKAGIRAQHPDADEARVLQLLRERLALVERLERGR